MEKNYKKLFGYITLSKPDSDLQSRIIARISTEGRREARVKAWAFGTGALVTFGTTLTLMFYLYDTFVRSGIYQYVSLALSGDSAVFASWKELGFSLLESTPVLSVIAILTALTACVWLSTNAFSNARRFTLIAKA